MIRIVYESEESKHYHNCITLVKYPATAFAWSNLQTMLSLFD